MKAWWVGLLLVWALAAGAASPEKFPEKKWFQNGKGYAEALELQKATGADLFVYFARYSPSDQKGLCHWFEGKSLQHPSVEKQLRDYIKVKFTFPLGKDDQAIADKFRVNKCPAVFVVQTNGWNHRVPVFDWPNNQPDLVPAEKLVPAIREKSGTRYHAL